MSISGQSMYSRNRLFGGFMRIETRIDDVLQDGTITRATYLAQDTLTITISRNSLDEPFAIEEIKVQSRNEEVLTKAFTKIQELMTETGVEVSVPRATLKSFVQNMPKLTQEP